ncbi:IS110 family transposase [Muricauda sp. SCSIO 64092]|uniref:IS110 family transposase n=1 Tax=Allomuricauda sp. SCSIO 64092 TaxID=2908842 RepID=UPI001FF34853|nr:IS110 family transposase [Muricauda sp. SCSIO 64092]UOY05498.1 IS110 family transposase [Muricauda sp. SCSIO 64092]UOY06182.1 IS110 family transposase [Muricauda sp. SCSIO 64092]UOY07763.1 IS110 family transposase [Muricauda sp. SCSIO 64092]UOY07866.1 IS110 family transposase [Muricauda sp. SCSIO 64092]
MKKEFIGIDVSKSTLDVYLYHGKAHKVFDNTLTGFSKLLAWAKRQLKETEPVFCFEHTGIYSLKLCEFMQQNQFTYFVISGLELKRSLGIKRGKNDKVDAQAIARYAFLFEKELTPYQLPATSLLKLKNLLTYRAKLVRQRTAHLNQITEQKKVLQVSPDDPILVSAQQIIQFLTKEILQIEKLIRTQIQQNQEITRTFKHITSIKGVGLILAVTLITATDNFKAFKTWRQFACYAGIAPFEHQSGTSIKGKTRISTLGNRTIKTLLSQAAATALQHDPEIKMYYQRRLKAGKSKMSTINVIRNKIVSRTFAVVKRDKPYVNLAKYAA